MTLLAKSQGEFKTSLSVELKDSIGRTILTSYKDGLVFNDKYYVFNRYKNSILLTDSLTKDTIGVIKRNLRSFSIDGNEYKITVRNSRGYNFVFEDKYKNQVAFVNYTSRRGYAIEIYNKGNDKLLPFIFLVTIGEINRQQQSTDLMHFFLSTYYLTY